MVAAGTGRLRPYDLGDLQLAFGIRGPDDGLVLAGFRWSPGVGPDDPGVGRHRCFNSAFIPGAAGIETDLHFADGVRSAEGDTAKFLFRSAQRLIMPG